MTPSRLLLVAGIVALGLAARPAAADLAETIGALGQAYIEVEQQKAAIEADAAQNNKKGKKDDDKGDDKVARDDKAELREAKRECRSESGLVDRNGDGKAGKKDKKEARACEELLGN